MKAPHYYLNIKLIKQVMAERGITVKQLVEGTDISERRINNYLQGRLPKKVSCKVGLLFRIKLDIKFEEMLTEEPPKS